MLQFLSAWKYMLQTYARSHYTKKYVIVHDHSLLRCPSLGASSCRLVHSRDFSHPVRGTVSRCFVALRQLYNRYTSSSPIRHRRLFSLVNGVVHSFETWLRKLRPGQVASLSGATTPVLMLRLVWCFVFVDMTTSSTLLQFSTGWDFHNGSTTRSRSWRSECCMVCPHHILISWLVLPTCLVAIVCVHQHHTSYAYRHIVNICRPSLVSGCCSHPLELSIPSDVQSSTSLSACLSTTTKDIPMS